jgi:hypothetical protein
MKKGAKFRLVVLLGLAALAAQNANAGSAVALGPHNHLVSVHGFSAEEAKHLALQYARSRYGANVRIVAATDVAGYCAIAVGRQPNGNMQLGIALGHPSAAEAAHVAIEQCLKAGGINPKVRWRFRG